MARRRKAYGVAVNPACPVEWAHPLNRGLIGCWIPVPNSGWNGNFLRDLVRGMKPPTDLLLVNGATWKPGRNTRALNCNGANTGGRATASARLKVDTLSIVWYGKSLATPNANGTFAGISYTTADTPPYTSAMFQVNSLGNYSYFNSRGGSFQNAIQTSTAPTVGADAFVVCTDIAGAQALYLNGSGTALGTAVISGSISYSASSQILSGAYYNGANPNILTYGLRFYNYIIPVAKQIELYQEARLGNRNTLRWLSTKVYSFKAAAVAGGFRSRIAGGLVIAA